MKQISSVDQLKPGQVLGADVVGVDGVSMALDGAVLDVETISRLRDQRISTVMLDIDEDGVRELIAAQPTVDDPESLFALNDLSHPLIEKLVEVSHDIRT